MLLFVSQICAQVVRQQLRKNCFLTSFIRHPESLVLSPGPSYPRKEENAREDISVACPVRQEPRQANMPSHHSRCGLGFPGWFRSCCTPVGIIFKREQHCLSGGQFEAFTEGICSSYCLKLSLVETTNGHLKEGPAKPRRLARACVDHEPTTRWQAPSRMEISSFSNSQI